jgi:hypothetical protein
MKTAAAEWGGVESVMQDQQRNDDAAVGGRRGGVYWNDPNIPCGNSPPLPRWPMVLAAVAWTAWIGFLVAMTVAALRSNAA